VSVSASVSAWESVLASASASASVLV